MIKKKCQKYTRLKNYPLYLSDFFVLFLFLFFLDWKIKNILKIIISYSIYEVLTFLLLLNFNQAIIWNKSKRWDK